MHSPIIYLIRKNNKNQKDYKGHLPKDFIPDDKTIYENIPEADWFESNTLTNKNWHHGDWSKYYLELLQSKNEFRHVNLVDNVIELNITKANIWNWYSRVIELQNIYTQALKTLHQKNKLFTFSPIEDMYDRIDYQNMIEQPYGGIRFVLFEHDTDADGNPDLVLYNIVSEKGLIEYAKDQIHMSKGEKTDIIFQVVSNVSSDYYFSKFYRLL